jgi:hypothetical protein
LKTPVAVTNVRETGDFGRYHLDRRKTPSPTLIGDYHVFSDRAQLHQSLNSGWADFPHARTFE